MLSSPKPEQSRQKGNEPHPVAATGPGRPTADRQSKRRRRGVKEPMMAKCLHPPTSASRSRGALPEYRACPPTSLRGCPSAALRPSLCDPGPAAGAASQPTSERSAHAPGWETCRDPGCGHMQWGEFPKPTLPSPSAGQLCTQQGSLTGIPRVTSTGPACLAYPRASHIPQSHPQTHRQ